MNIQKCRLSLYNEIWGQDININYFVVGEGSPKVYIQGGIHGGEVTFWIFEELINRLKRMKILGLITLVPICNPLSWAQKTYFYTFGKFSLVDGKDFNRNFPGNVLGSLPERIANKLIGIASSHDIWIDLHTANYSKPYFIVTDKKLLSWAKISRMKYTVILKFKDEKNLPFTEYGVKIGKVSFAIECGPHDNYKKEYVNEVVDALENILVYAKVVKYRNKKIIEEIKSNEQFYSDTLKIYYSPYSGFVYFNKNIHSKVRKGETVCIIFNPNSLGDKKIIKAKEDFILFLHTRTHIVREGDYLYEVIPLSRLRHL